MKLSLDTVRYELNRFAIAYGMPKHFEDSKQKDKALEIYHQELARHFCQEKFLNRAVPTAWTKARKFPTVSDFFEGYGGKEIKANGEINSIDDLKKMGYTFDD